MEHLDRKGQYQLIVIQDIIVIFDLDCVLGSVVFIVFIVFILVY